MIWPLEVTPTFALPGIKFRSGIRHKEFICGFASENGENRTLSQMMASKTSAALHPRILAHGCSLGKCSTFPSWLLELIQYSIPSLNTLCIERCYRFNRRFQMNIMVDRLTYVALRTLPVPQRILKLAEVRW
jgi:hypothetical protein